MDRLRSLCINFYIRSNLVSSSSLKSNGFMLFCPVCLSCLYQLLSSVGSFFDVSWSGLKLNFRFDQVKVWRSDYLIDIWMLDKDIVRALKFNESMAML